jgi:hypothetical protein
MGKTTDWVGAIIPVNHKAVIPLSWSNSGEQLPVFAGGRAFGFGAILLNLRQKNLAGPGIMLTARSFGNPAQLVSRRRPLVGQGLQTSLASRASLQRSLRYPRQGADKVRLG